MKDVIVTTFDWLSKEGYVGVTDYCRYLITTGHDWSGTTIEVYRGDLLCLIVKDINKASTIMAKDCHWIKYDKTRRKASQEPRTLV